MNKYYYSGYGPSSWYCSNPNNFFHGQEQDSVRQTHKLNAKPAKIAMGIQWVEASKGTIPLGAITAGYEADGTPLYIARAHHSSGLHIGKLKPISKGANIPVEGVEVSTKFYEVLVLM